MITHPSARDLTPLPSSWPGLTRPSASIPLAPADETSRVERGCIAGPRVRPKDDEGWTVAQNIGSRAGGGILWTPAMNAGVTIGNWTAAERCDQGPIPPLVMAELDPAIQPNRPSARTVFLDPRVEPGGDERRACAGLSASSIGRRPLVEPDAIPAVAVVTRPPSLPSSWPGSTRPSSRAVRARGRSFWAPGSSPGPTRGERVRRLSASSIGTRPLAEPDAIPAVAVVTRPPSLPSSWPGSTRPSSRTGRARGRSLCPPSPGSTPATTRAETAPHLSIVPDRHPGFIAGVQQPRPLNAPRTANGPHP